MRFLDPKKPLATCSRMECTDCSVEGILHCHFTFKDLLYFFLIGVPSFIVGGAGIVFIDSWLLVPWVAIIVGFFGFVEIRVLCTHCPHYLEDGATLKCWANYGSPKIWSYRPGPMSVWEKAVFFLGLILVWGFPLLLLAYGVQLLLLLIFVVTTLSFFVTLRIHNCSQCINFACPLNAVPDDVRREFFKHNPTLARDWCSDNRG